MAKRSARGDPRNASPVPTSAPADAKYPIAKTRQGKRVATVYLDPEALKALQRITIDEDTTLQALLTEGVNAVFKARKLLTSA